MSDEPDVDPDDWIGGMHTNDTTTENNNNNLIESWDIANIGLEFQGKFQMVERHNGYEERSPTSLWKFKVNKEIKFGTFKVKNKEHGGGCNPDEETYYIQIKTKIEEEERQVSPSRNNTAEEIKGLYAQYNEDFSGISEDILEAWKDTLRTYMLNNIDTPKYDEAMELRYYILSLLSDIEIKEDTSFENMKILYYGNRKNLSFVSDEILQVWGYNTREFRTGDGSYGDLAIAIKEELQRRGLTEAFIIETWVPSLNRSGHGRIKEMTGKILGALQIVGSVVAVIVLAIIGIKYMFSSIEEKAKYKETMIPYIVGCVMLLGISTFATVIYNVAMNIN